MPEEHDAFGYYAGLLEQLRTEVTKSRSAVDIHAERATPFFRDVAEHERILKGVNGGDGLVARVSASERSLRELRELVDKLNTPHEVEKLHAIDWKRVGEAVAAAAGILAFLGMLFS